MTAPTQSMSRPTITAQRKQAVVVDRAAASAWAKRVLDAARDGNQHATLSMVNEALRISGDKSEHGHIR